MGATKASRLVRFTGAVALAMTLAIGFATIWSGGSVEAQAPMIMSGETGGESDEALCLRSSMAVEPGLGILWAEPVYVLSVEDFRLFRLYLGDPGNGQAAEEPRCASEPLMHRFGIGFLIA